MTDQRPFNDDLLSAWFDSEATADERAEVERRLAGSDEARLELAEIGRLSALVRTLPHERLPEHFAAQVLARAEREMLLAGPAPAGEAAGAAARPRRRARWFALGSVLATAAAVLVITFVVGPPQRRDTIAMRSDEHAGDARADAATALGERLEQAPSRPTGAAGPEAAIAARDGAVPERGRDASRAQPAVPSAGAARMESFAEDAAPAEPRVDAPAAPLADRAEPAAEADLAADRAPRASALPDVGRSDPAAATFDALAGAPSARLPGLRAGDIVRYAQQSEDGVAVIELTVVDVQDAIGAMQVLLVRSGEPAEDEALKRSGDQRDATAAGLQARDREPAGPASRPRPGELLAIYVESPGDRLAAALEEMQRRGLLDRPQLRPPVDPDGVEVAIVAPEAPARSAPVDETQARPETPVSLAAAVHHTKSRGLAVAGEEALRQNMLSRAARTPTRPADVAERQAEARRDVQPQAADARGDRVPAKEAPTEPASDGTFQLVFRPDEKSLAAGSSPAARRIARSPAAPRPDATPPQRGAEAGPAVGPTAPLRVIFVFRQG